MKMMVTLLQRYKTLYANSSSDVFLNHIIHLHGIQQTYSNIFCPLIWKALLVAGYDVPGNWIKYYVTHDEDKQRYFNDLVKFLAAVPGWADYTVYILSKREYRDKDYPNTIPDERVTEVSNEVIAYMQSHPDEVNAIIQPLQFDKYKAKYLKYKQKYLSLKNTLN